MSEKKYDLVVVGAGSAGQSVAMAAVKAGKSVAMTEGRAYGGTCPLRGCDPKLILHGVAEAAHRVAHLRGKGFTDSAASSWPQLMEWKRSFTGPMPAKSRAKMKEAGIEVYDEYASFTGTHTLKFGDKTTVTAKTIVLATGQQPTPLDFPGHELMLTSDDFLEMDDLPKEMVIVGGGYIAMESAHIANAMGCKVTLIVKEERPLTGFDPDLIELLKKSDEERGITFLIEREAVAVRKKGKRFEVDAESKEGTVTTLTTDRVLHCAGRVPNIDELDLDKAGIKHDKGKGIKVDKQLRTNLDHVYALGDCCDHGLALTPVASHQAELLSNILFDGSDNTLEELPIPTVAFCLPGVASVGMTAEEAEEDKRDLKISYQETTDWFNAHHLNAPVSAYKVIVDPKSDRVLGAHLLGPSATELINLFTLALRYGTTTTELKKMIFAYPTAASQVKSMLS